MIRNGVLNDAAEMANIFNYYVRTSTVIFSNTILDAEDMRRKIKPIAGNFPFLIWEEEGKVLGYCYAHHFHPDPVYSQTWEITAYLDHNATGRGMGTKLLRRLIDDCRKAGAHTLVSFVTGGNQPCERLMATLGFAKVGIIKDSGYKFDEYLDDIVFQRML